MKTESHDLIARDAFDDCVDGYASKTVEKNCQMLCRTCNREKAAK